MKPRCPRLAMRKALCHCKATTAAGHDTSRIVVLMKNQDKLAVA